MAMKTGAYTVTGQLYDMDSATTYASGGGRVSLGRANSAHAIEIQPVVELIGTQEAGGVWTRARLMGYNFTYEVILEDYSTDLMDLIFSKLDPSGYAYNYHGGLGQTNHYFGYDAQTTKLAIIDSDATRPAIYFPKAVVVGAARISLTRNERIFEGTRLTIAALIDPTLGTPVYFGDIAGFPALS